MKMEFVDEAELQKAAEEPEDEVRGVKAVLSAAARAHCAGRRADGAFHCGGAR